MVKTVGASAIVSYKNKYIFEIQKSKKWQIDSSGQIRIGIGCIGGAIEQGEMPSEALQREALEEIGTNIEILEWKHPFKITADLDVHSVFHDKENQNLFFHWFGTKEPYRTCRICVFLGKITNKPVPDDLGGVLVTDIQLFMKFLEKDYTLNQGIERGMEIYSKEKIPLNAKIKTVGTVKKIKELYNNHFSRIQHLL